MSLSAPRIIICRTRTRTVVGRGRHATTTLAIDVAHILLEARVGDTARSCSDRAAGILGAWGREGEGGEREDGGDGALHIGCRKSGLDVVFCRERK